MIMSMEDRVKDRALELGADFVGIAPAARFENAPEWSHPKKRLANFHSVVAFGIAMSRGALEAWFSKSDRRLQVLDDRCAFQEVDKVAYYLTRWLEKAGYKSVFVSQNLMYNAFRGRPDFSHKHAAMAAGLGRLGMSSNFVHTKYGASVHLCSIITEAELEPDPTVSDEDDPCHRCQSCINICPAQAISRERTKSFTMEGQEYTHQWVNRLRCAWGCGGLSGHRYQIGNHTVGTWAYNDLPIPDDPRQFSGEVYSDRQQRHPMELAEMVVTETYARLKRMGG